MALREVVDRQFDAASVTMQIVDQRRFIGKVIATDVYERLMKCNRLNDGAVAGLRHDDIDRGHQAFE
jgi:hypothetical protein